MKALIAAGGHGTRLRPLTYTINKHLVPLANKPMIYYALEKVAETKIKEVAININQGDKEIKQIVGSGKKWGLNITYLEQAGGALGVAHVVKNALDWIGKDDLLFYLGDNIVLAPLQKLIDKFKKKQLDCLLGLTKVSDPERFGVPVFDKQGRLLKIEEKPQKPKSDYAVTGIYIYSNAVREAVQKIQPGPRGELEISDVHTYLIETNKKVGYEELTGWWKDTGKPDVLLEGNSLILANIELDIKGKVKKGAIIEGKVIIEKGTQIAKNCLIRGPVVIGKNCKLENTTIEPYTSIGDNCDIQGAEISHSIICDEAKINCNKRIVDSLIGPAAQVSSQKATKPSGHKLILGNNTLVEL
ncbi:MAG: glucose-1-phosphate thymidylyltransferase [Candidatus Moranbacteria bacterium]|nr:glucose-1-phosphate thymidylyltransferase [Candidatus Moranbacteria bacterium]